MSTFAIKEMPYTEKYDSVMDFLGMYESFVPSFIRERLGLEGEAELRRRWQEAVEPVPIEAVPEEQYEKAYANFIAMARINFQFIREKLGHQGIKEFEAAEVEALKRANTDFATTLLGLIRAISRATAFKMTAEQFAYDIQWMTPSKLVEHSRDRLVFDIPSCKILDYEDTDDICFIGCQRAFPAWVADQFKVDLSFNRQGKRCTCTVMPL
jgi:hypothetical protein